jgi:hypothetical protein
MYCPAFEFDQGMGFYTNPGLGGEEQPINTFDRINHCMCEHLGGRFGNCEDPEEKQKQDCLTNPFGPDDGPRPECARFMKPGDVDTSAFEALLCQKMMPNCGNVFIDIDSSCGCLDSPVAVGDAQDLCPNRDVIRCAEDAVFDVTTCSCRPVDSGNDPFFVRPGCRVGNDTFPGGLDRYTLSSDGAAWLDRRPVVLDGTLVDRDVLQFRPGYSAVATPGFYIEDFAERGDTVYADLLLPERVPQSGWQGLAQFHVTVGDLYTEFAGEEELTGLVPGERFRAQAQLSPTAQRLMAESGKQAWVTMVMATDNDAPEPIGVVDLGFVGRQLSGVTGVSPICPNPDPILPGPVAPDVEPVTQTPPGFFENFAD